jgi:hypothetical protein
LKADHIEFLLEEPSMEAFLNAALPAMLPNGVTFSLHVYQGKYDLLRKLPARLQGYQSWLPENYRIVVLVDRDADDALQLKQTLEAVSAAAGLITKTAAANDNWQSVNRIAIEELEAWYFGDWEAVKQAYPKVKSTVPQKAGFRDPDSIAGGTWEAFERTLQGSGYFKEGLRKVEAALAVAAHFNAARCTSVSLRHFKNALDSATA